MTTVLAIVALVIAGLGHLLLIGFCFMGMPNSSPAQMWHIQKWMIAIGVVGVVMVVGGALLIRGGHPWWCTGLALVSPIAMFIVLYNFSD